MDVGDRDDVDRRSWMASTMRWCALSTLAGVSAVLLTRRGSLAPADRCTRRAACERCSMAGRCRLPEAVQLRQERRKES